MSNKFQVVRKVLGQIENMYHNNLEGSEEGWCEFYETFDGWCEDGEVFNGFLEEDVEDCVGLMKRISPYVDALTNEIGQYLEL